MLAWFWCPDRQETVAKKPAAFVCWAILPARVQNPLLTLFLFLRGQDTETEKLFPHFHKLQKSAFPESKWAFVFRLSSHRYWTRRTFFFTLSSSHCTSATFSLFLHQRNSIMHGHCSRGERLWPLASPPGYERHKGPSCILSGASGRKKDHLKTNRTSLFLLMTNLLRALFLSLKKMDFTF